MTITFPQTDIEHAMQHEIDTLRAEVERLKSEVKITRYRLLFIAKDKDELRAEIERLTEWGGEKVIEVCTLRAENENLRELLVDLPVAYSEAERLRKALEQVCALYTSENYPSVSMFNAARAALQSKGKP